MRRKICVVTGSRSEYGLLKPILEKIKSNSNLRLQLVTTGMHLSVKYNYTEDIIRKNGFRPIASVPSLCKGNTGFNMACSAAKGIKGLSLVFKKIKPDIVLILGDRVEVLSAAIASMYMNIPIAHVHGGDIGAGCVDNFVRDAVTKIANIHFAASKKSAGRILRLGEQCWRVFTTGAPGLDSILKVKLLSRNELSKKYGLDFNKRVILVLQHPVTTEIEDAGKQMEETLQAIIRLKEQTIIVYPNSDAGGLSIIKTINKYKKYKFIKIYKNIESKDFLSLMKNCSVMVGNSSSGIIEAPSFRIPVINIGIRQIGREHSTNVIYVSHERRAIFSVIKKAFYDKNIQKQVKKCKNPYGDGHASERIIRVLSTINLDKKLLQKQMTY